MTAVARVDVPVDNLAAKILGACGKDPARVAAVLARGTLVSGDSRFRWQPIEASPGDLAALLRRFPDHDPKSSFRADGCLRVTFRGRRGEFEINREVGLQRRVLRRRNFWDGALPVLEALEPRCERYSYSEEADVFVARLDRDACDRLRPLASLLPYTSLQRQVEALAPSPVQALVRRP